MSRRAWIGWGTAGVLVVGSAVVGLLLRDQGGVAAAVARLGGSRLTIVYTNDSRGELDPCQCSERDGGIARRATLIDQIRREGDPLLIVDSGDTVGRIEKLDPVMGAMELVGYTHLGLGGLDGLLREEFISAAQRYRMVVHSLAEGDGAQVVEVGGLRIAIIGVGSDHLAMDSKDLARQVAAAAEGASGSANLVVVLSQVGKRADLATADALRGSSLPVLLIGSRVWSGLEEPQVEGAVRILPTSYLGRCIGRIDISGRPPGLRIESSLLPVAETLAPDEEIQRIVDGYYGGEREAAHGLVDVSARALAETRPSYCGGCHREQMDTWMAHGHSRAVDSLAIADKVIPECLVCHSEVFRREHRVSTELDVEDGVQCVTCHGPAVGHDGTEVPMRPNRPTSSSVCIPCHTPERDPDFDYEAALEALRHWE